MPSSSVSTRQGFDRGARRATLLAAARALLPPALDEATRAAIVDDFMQEVAAAPEAAQTGLGGLLDVLDRRAVVALLGGRFTPLQHQSPEDVERFFARLSKQRLPQLRGAMQAIRRGLAFIGYGRSEPGGTNPLWPPMSYPGPRADRHALTMTNAREDELPIGALVDAPDEVDVIVVGSGPGGSIAAAVFAAAGRSVLVLEEGSYRPPARVDQRELAGYRELFLDRGGTATEDLAIGILSGRAVGGGTVVNWNASLRVSDAVGADWDAASGLDGLAASLTPHYDAVAARLGLAASPDNANNGALRRGCEKLGLACDVIPRNASGCGQGCGYCTFGCGYGKKQDMPRTYLRDAVRDGAQVIAGARVDKVILERGRAVGIVATDATSRTRTLRAKMVVVAAGSLRTPQLLTQSGVRARMLGAGLHLHPASCTFGVFDEAIEPWHGPPMTTVTKHWAKERGSHGVVVEAAPLHPGLASVAIPWMSAAQHARSMQELSRTACLVAIARDRDTGEVRPGTPPTIRYRVSRHDGAHLLAGLSGAARILFAAGAREIYTAHTPWVRLERKDASESGLRRLDETIARAGHAPHRLAIFSAHQMGSARMHARARDGVVDERGEVHGVRGLLVTDASTFPCASGVNPMLTILAMARRIAMLHA